MGIARDIISRSSERCLRSHKENGHDALQFRYRAPGRYFLEKSQRNISYQTYGVAVGILKIELEIVERQSLLQQSAESPRRERQIEMIPSGGGDPLLSSIAPSKISIEFSK